MQVNRYLKDKAMNRIDHALGQPLDPMAESYRNYFATDAGSSEAAQFAASPHWDQGVTRGDMVWFHVSDAGRRALRDHLREVGDKHRLYTVSWDGFDMPQIATSHSKAKYAKWQDISDSYDIPFTAFLTSARVRLARSEEAR